jgi:hypothetical protein
MLPALSALARTMTQSVTAADGFKSIGASIGEGLITTAKGALYATQAVRSLASSLEFLAKVKIQPTSARAAFADLREELTTINRETERAVERLTFNFHEARRQARMPPPPPPPPAPGDDGLVAKLAAQEAAAKAAAKAAQELHDAWEPLRKLEADLRGETADFADAQRLLNDAMGATTALTGKITDANIEQANASRRVTESIDAQIKAQEDAALEMQAMIELAEKGTDAQKRLAGAWLEHELALKHAAPVLDEWKDAQEALSAGFDRFVESLSSGSVTAAEAFRGMVQSILADLLKLLAKQAILKMFGPGAGGAPLFGSAVLEAHGDAFAGGRILPFARGGVISRRMTMPMALMGEAGPEAVLPLRRGANGNLGVESAGAAPLNIAIHNHADARVSAQRDNAGDLQILIEATKRSMAVDIRRGGNEVSRAAEAAWRLSRGASAPI